MLAAADGKRAGAGAIESVVFDAETIDRRVAELGAELTDFYPGGDLLILGALKGSFVFMADLVRRIERPLQVDFLRVASYGKGTRSSGDVQLLYDPETELEGKHILLVEDIIETGNTLNRLVRLLRERNPASLELCALLHKRLVTDLELEPRWVGFDAPPAFLVGYGLDHAEDFRHLPFVATLKG